MNRLIRFTLTALLAVSYCLVASSHPADENPDLTLPETTVQLQQDRFGMAIHWGIYSTLGSGEMVMKDRDMSLDQYERLPLFFNPAKFDPHEWVMLAKAAGMRYITFTAKDRDGFAMWNSAASDWNVVNRTPFARDVVKDLAEACRREGIKLFLSYSPRDWHHSQVVAVDTAPMRAADADETMTTASVDFTTAQVRELLTNYGKIDGVRLDNWWNYPGRETQLRQVYELIHSLQPAALVATDHGQTTLPGENFQILQPGFLQSEKPGSASALTYAAQPLEVSDTINESWGYNITDSNYKSTRELVHQLVRSAGNDANLLMNVAPMPNGEIPQEISDRLKRVGMWLAKHGESIYSTRGGPTAPQSWGVTTHRRHKVYVHVLDPETTSVEVQLPHPLRTARYLLDESEAPFEVVEGTEHKVVIKLRPEQRGEMERLLVLETKQYESR